jgi:hypothetical protein
MRKHKSLRERLLGLTIFRLGTECWLFVGWRLPNGYGHIGSTGRGKKTLLAHRASWIAFNGPIPSGLQVLHRCDVRACINPDHLFLGTPKDNMDDMDAKGRRRTPSHNGEKNPFSKLTEEQAKTIRYGSKTAAEYAKEFGVAKITAQQCRRGHSWKHI